ncbi:MAG TPA: tRNA (N(6)-L-threonylcarbamoyladenosine(37)-C(2))-methylthiotransferase MtaB, partial [Firmicutes bacterium]|nr:tRNA (N(6)-L-threonylcarbamoyladenosine(37)-C(2))-methylthiotransferase MtaB [Bacillota bacterium]
MAPTIAFHTLGCKVNQYDTGSVAALFREAGYEVVDFSSPADVYVVNTCTVTGLGEKKSRQMLRRARRQNPRAVVVALGCYAQTAPSEVAGIPGVDLVVGTAGRRELVRLVDEARRHRSAASVPESDGRGPGDAGGGPAAVAVEEYGRTAAFEELGTGAVVERTRATVKVQEGCRQFCSYCKVPYARGPERSRPPAAVLAEVERLVAAGFSEVVLTGIHLGSYGRDLEDCPAWDLARLAARVAGVPGLARLRLSSVEPTDVTDELIALVRENPVLCRHFHLPLQSGDDAILRRMNRRYTTAEYARVAERIRAAVPEVAVTTDLIAGFPGETEESFARTLAFVQEMAFSRLHVFPYSRRRGTPAAAFPAQVPAPVKRARVDRLIALGRELSFSYN